MSISSRCALLLVVSVLSPMTVAWAQTTVYRCGNSYSQTPCPEGKAVSVDDRRSAAQQQLAQSSAERQAKQAEGLEKDRIKQEREQAKNLAKAQNNNAGKGKQEAKSAPAPKPTVLTPKRMQPPGHKPDQFVAKVPGTGHPAKSKKPDASEQKTP